jgi:hypothetical protein
VVDFGHEVDAGRFERVVGRESEVHRKHTGLFVGERRGLVR